MGYVLGMRASWRSLARTSVRFSPGLNVLYGLNGSGKTTVLSVLESALDGRELEPGIDAAASIYGSDPVSKSIQVYLRGLTAIGVSQGEVRYANEQTDHWTELTEWIRGTGLPPRPDYSEMLRDQEILQMVAGVGGGDPQWEVAAAVEPDAPGVREEIARLNGWWQSLEDRRKEVETRWGPPEDFKNVRGELQDLPEFEQIYFKYLHGEQDSLGQREFFPDLSPLLPLSTLDWRSDRLIDDDGLPVAVALLGRPRRQQEFPGLFGYLMARDLELPDLQKATRDELIRALHLADDVAQPFTADLVAEWAEGVEPVANRYYRQLLLDAPMLSLHIGDPRDWVAGDPWHWLGDGYPIEALSRAQRRWASIAIQLALSEGQRTSTRGPLYRGDFDLLLIDEPESALHRSAERHMAEGLQALGAAGIQVIAATHSPWLLDAPDASVLQCLRVNHSTRIPGQGIVDVTNTEVRPIGAPEIGTMAALGLAPSDLLARNRVILLVEGHHEEVILDELLGPELARLRIQVLALHGGRNFPEALDSRLLVDFTDAQIVALVDNGQPDRVQAVWDEAMMLAITDGPAAAGAFIRKSLPPREAIEHKFLGQFMSRALELGVQSRVHPYALPEPDILQYLPASAFVKKKTWETLRARYTEEDISSDFKTWVAKTFKAHFDDAALRRACGELDAIPSDLTDLLDALTKIATSQAEST